MSQYDDHQDRTDCPSWCTASHQTAPGVPDVVRGTPEHTELLRTHRRPLFDGPVAVAVEQADGSPVVTLSVPDSGYAELPAAEARRVAGALAKGADMAGGQ